MSPKHALPPFSLPFSGPVVLVVMDGYGLPPLEIGSAIAAAKKPHLDNLFANFSHCRLQAHGTAVGMPSDEDVGNSEVGHNAMGAGQVYAQGASLVSDAIFNGTLWKGKGWQEVIQGLSKDGTLHLLGLFSDGNVHSHLDHLKALIVQAKKEGLPRVRVHVLLDGRDVAERSALEYVDDFSEFLAGVNDKNFDVRIASGGGRQFITMDRYGANWAMVERGWQTHVKGQGRQFPDVRVAIETLRSENPDCIDQDLPAFVIAEKGLPIGKILSGDAVVFFNFRGDRAIEISRAFEDEKFDFFDRGDRPHVMYAGMLQYDGDLQLPKRFLLPPPAIANTSSEWFSQSGITQFACSETQKFGHVTYFWNGNRSQGFKGETVLEIPSDGVPFEERPWMKAAEITDAMIDALKSKKYRFLRCNFANGDMVGHTGNFRATTMAVEAVDLALGRLLKAVKKAGGIALITADHGNADEMYEIDKKTGLPSKNKNDAFSAKTAHTLNPVPLILFDAVNDKPFKLQQKEGARLSNIAATIANLLGYEKHASWDESLLDFSEEHPDYPLPHLRAP